MVFPMSLPMLDVRANNFFKLDDLSQERGETITPSGADSLAHAEARVARWLLAGHQRGEPAEATLFC